MTEPRHDEGPEVRPETTAILAGRAAAGRGRAVDRGAPVSLGRRDGHRAVRDVEAAHRG